MRKFLLTAVAVVIGVVVLAAASFVVFFPKRQAVALIEQRIEAATGRELTLAGNVDVTFWPALGVSAERASLSNPHDFSNAKPFFAADKIVFAVAVLPLLTGHIEVKQLILEGADLELAAKADGHANWEFPTQSTTEHRSSLQDLKLDDVRLDHSRISFEGGDGGAPFALENVDASLTLTSLDQPAHLRAGFERNNVRFLVVSDIAQPRAVLEQQGATPYSVTLQSQLVNAAFNGSFNAANGMLNGHITADGPSLRQVLAWAGSPLGPGGGFGAFRAEAQMAHIGDNTDLTQLALHLDATDARGSLSIAAPPQAKLHVSGNLSAPLIDFNPYLPPPPRAAPGAAGGVQAGLAWPTDPIDFSGLNALNADVTLAAGQLKFQRMSFANADLTLRIADGAADARLTRLTLYGGQGTAHLAAGTTGGTPRIGFEIDAQNVNALPFLTDAIGLDKIEGRGRVVASIAGQGRTQSAIMHALAGTASFDFTDGAWRGVNLGQVAQVISTLQGRPPAQGATSATQFSEMSASFNLANGQAATQNLQLNSPVLRLTGAGIIDIGQQTIDMRIEPHSVNTQHAQTAQAVLGVPFQIKGPWAHASFSPDVSNLLRNQLQQRMQSLQQGGNPLAGLFGGHAAQPSTQQPHNGNSTSTSTSTATTRQPSVLDQILQGHH